MTENNPKKPFEAAGRPVLIGSLPLTDYQEALDWIYASTPDIPLWPQLPATHLGGMLNQFNEGLPGIVEQDARTYFSIQDANFEAEQLRFYEEYLQVLEDPGALLSSRFQVSRERAGGIFKLLESTRTKTGLTAVKGQITGPFTLLTGLKDENDRLGYYDPTIRDIMVKGLAMKAAWQVRLLKQEVGDLPVLLFIDEPALAGLGSSSFISVSLDDLGQDLGEVISAIQEAGGLAGVHVCANTDWNLLLTSEIDILSFDAYSFFDRFVTCKDRIIAYLERGGTIAWGLVPTSEPEHITGETAESLAALWEKQAALLQSATWDLPALLGRTLISPSCGTGSLSRELAGRVLDLTRDVSIALREKYC